MNPSLCHNVQVETYEIDHSMLPILSTQSDYFLKLDLVLNLTTF